MAGVVATSYSEALFTLALEENKLGVFCEDLKTIVEILNDNKELKAIMKHPKIGKNDKKEVLSKVFAGADPYVLNFMKLMVDKSRFSHFEETCKVFLKMYNEHEGIAVAYVQSAVALSEEEKEAIQKMLEKRTNKKIEMRCKVNEDLIAGLRIKIDDDILDNSAATQLAKMKNQVIKTTL